MSNQVLNEEELQAIRERAEAATPEPWFDGPVDSFTQKLRWAAALIDGQAQAELAGAGK